MLNTIPETSIGGKATGAIHVSPIRADIFMKEHEDARQVPDTTIAKGVIQIYATTAGSSDGVGADAWNTSAAL